MSVNEWYNAVQTQVTLAKYPQETAQILQRDIFWFFLKDESFVSKTLNEGHVELSKFPASTVHQLAKKMESSQPTAKHMNQVARDPHAVQVNLLRHQCTELPPSKFQRKQKKSFRARQATNKSYQEDTKRERMTQAHGRFHKNQQAHAIHKKYSSKDRCSKCGDTLHVQGFRYPASRYKCKNGHKVGHFSRLCFKKKESEYKKDSRQPRAHQLKVGRASVESSSYDQFDTNSSSSDSFCLQRKIKLLKLRPKCKNHSI